MICSRLLAAALVIGATLASGQNQPLVAPGSKNVPPDPGALTKFFACCSTATAPAASPTEPWMIAPEWHVNADTQKSLQGYFPARTENEKPFQFDARLLRPDVEAKLLEAERHALEADKACFAIRSYVVARDAKDSDSTHPVSYSTCISSDRYSVKSAEIRLHSADR